MLSLLLRKAALTRAPLPAVSALGLIDHENDATKSVAYSTLIQTFNRYLLEQMNTESTIPKSTLPQLIKGPAIVPPLPPLAQVVKLDLHSASSCQSCGAKSDRDTGVNVIDLSYPRKVSQQIL